MTIASLISLFCAAAAVSLALTFMVRRYAITRSILDTPNGRSLHAQPVPRGGGLAIVATFLGGVILLTVRGATDARLAIALVGGGLLIALVGWQDDRHSLSARVRFVAHVLAAIWALSWLGGFDAIQLGDAHLRLSFVGHAIAVIGIVWWINLYNFMDGIDGIAGGQALTVAGAAALLIASRGENSFLVLPILLAAASVGFLILNWAPARIFMGDVGSGFLGYTFAVLAIAAEKNGSLPFVYWVLLSGVFIFDSTATLLRRIAHGERWYSAHRSHAYQRLVQFGYSHRSVTIGVLSLNVLLLGAMLLGALKVVHFGIAVAIVLALLSACYLAIERLQPMNARDVAGQRDGITSG